MSASRWVHVHVDRIIRETDRAFLMLIGEEQVWIPRSQISDEYEYGEGDEDCTISVTEWIAEEKGLEGEDDA